MTASVPRSPWVTMSPPAVVTVAPPVLLLDPSLSSLIPSTGTLSPAFDPATTMYTLDISPDTTGVLLVPAVTYPGHATIMVNGAMVASGAPSTLVPTPRFRPFLVTVTTDGGATRSYTVVVRGIPPVYIKAFNTGSGDLFGNVVALSGDGTTLAVGAYYEASSATGINGTQMDDSALQSGAVYIFVRMGLTWSPQAYIKASNTAGGDLFGSAIGLSHDGSTLAVGALGEDSVSTGINGNQSDNSARNAGAVYVFTRRGAMWSQQAYIKASNTNADDDFGASVALSADGSTLAVDALYEASRAKGVDGNQMDNGAPGAGAVYVFTRMGTPWSQQAYIKASNTAPNNDFGSTISLSMDGSTLAIGAYLEASHATGVNGDQTQDPIDFFSSGAVYVFTRTGTVWSQQAYIKASNTIATNGFGIAVSLSADGSTLAVGANGEASSAHDVDGDQSQDLVYFPAAGAVYVFMRTDTTWAQEAYVKASNTDMGDQFGIAVSLSADGSILAVGAQSENSSATGIDGDQTNNSAADSGAVYVY